MAKSEFTKNMTDDEIKDLQDKVKNMTEDELIAFRNSFDPDSMGFCGEEGVTE
jgi:hypothetical protein